MSRIGLKPIVVPAGVEVKIALPLISVKGPKGNLSKEFPGGIQFEVKDKEITLKRPDDKRNNRMLHGTYRAILANMVKGVSEGFERTLDLVGVGCSCGDSSHL
jgi:large subunit ribosomal protein L6